MLTNDLQLNAKRAAAAASALHVGIVELEARAFHGLNVVDLDPFEIHGAHLVDGNFQSVKLENLVSVIGLVLKRHVILKPRAAAAHHGYAQRRGRVILHAHDFFDFGAGSGRQINHKVLWPPVAGQPRSSTDYSKPFVLPHNARVSFPSLSGNSPSATLLNFWRFAYNMMHL